MVERAAPGPPTGPGVVVPRSAGGAGLVYLSFVQELADCVPLWQRMRAEHVPTPEGFCAARPCGRGGYGSPHLRWPCAPRSLADHAALAHDARLRRGP